MSNLSSSSSSEEEEDGDSVSREELRDMMKLMKIECGEEDEVYSRPCCEKCKHVQQSHGKKIIPERLSRGRLQAQLEGEGTYECELTGLIFEASERVLVAYSLLSWSKFNTVVQNPWMIAGPIFNVHVVDRDASALKSVQLPHSLCLAGQEKEKLVLGVLHVTGQDPVIEDVLQSSGSHVKWTVSSRLSPVGAVARDAQRVAHHGAAMLYEDLDSGGLDAHVLRLYLASCNSSHVKDMKSQMKKGRFRAVDINTFCLLLEQNYSLRSEPSGELHPQHLPFTVQSLVFCGFFEAYYEQPPPFTLNLKVHRSDVTAWTATIHQGDLLGSTDKEPSALAQQLLLGSSNFTLQMP